jgi:ABC-type nickel/cobalt efflux system permease component RcnA
MSRPNSTLLLIRVGIVLLGLASVCHLFEHWETASLEKCIAQCDHSHASSDSSSDDSSHTDHKHGCSAHEHSPAVLQSALLFLPQLIVLASPEESVTAPPSVHRKIDHPPRLS